MILKFFNQKRPFSGVFGFFQPTKIYELEKVKRKKFLKKYLGKELYVYKGSHSSSHFGAEVGLERWRYVETTRYCSSYPLNIPSQIFRLSLTHTSYNPVSSTSLNLSFILGFILASFASFFLHSLFLFILSPSLLY